ncbi:MAG: aminoacetone oxidase family FAD-binding enzyme [Clostridia bacterium]|nr:aminoacetone oxidase family FAD-binding enzyme [Clostridia bacterium]
MYDLLIIGGGVSGMVAAVTAARRGKSVLILERAEKVGKKLLATGNGKCNMANTAGIANKYNNDFAYPMLEKYDLDLQRNFFHSIGVLTKEVEGRIYPYSEQASSVLNALRKELDNLGVRVVVGECVTRIDLAFNVGGYKAKSVLLATGSKATFGEHSAHLYEKFGHQCTDLRPALVPMLTAPNNLKGLRGVRLKALVKLFADGKYVAECRDEVIFKDNGVSGTAIFNLSLLLARLNARYAYLSLDLMPEYNYDEVREIIKKLGGIDNLFHKEIVNNILRKSDGIDDMARTIKNYQLDNARLGSMELAQVTSGGLVTTDFDNLTLESKLQKGLYASGEVLDVDGECGGYNIMWAVASGMAVGENV